jgi:hypothetical protein
VCVGVCWRALVFVGVRLCVLVCVGVCWCASVCVGVRRCVLVCAGVCYSSTLLFGGSATSTYIIYLFIN